MPAPISDREAQTIGEARCAARRRATKETLANIATLCVADAFPPKKYGVSARSLPRRCHPILVPDPFERSTMRISPGYRTTIHRHQESARCRGDPATVRHFREDPGRLIGDPIRTERRDPFGEGLPFRSPRHIGQDRRMEDDKRGILWSLAAELRDVVSQQVALRVPRPASRGDCQSGPQVHKPLRLLRPDEAFQPTDL